MIVEQIRRLTTNQEIAGSNPVVDFLFYERSLASPTCCSDLSLLACFNNREERVWITMENIQTERAEAMVWAMLLRVQHIRYTTMVSIFSLSLSRLFLCRISQWAPPASR